MGSDKEGCLAVSGSGYRAVMLILISLICFGSYFEYDKIEAIETNIEAPKTLNPAYCYDKHDVKLANCTVGGGLGLSSEQFLTMYSVYSYPNMVLVFFGGLMGDILGFRMGAFICVTLVVAGSALVTAGGLISNYWVMVGGRTIFGMGAETLNVIQSSMISLWFTGTANLSMAFGLVLAMSRLGDFLSLTFMLNIAEFLHSWRKALAVGTILCGLSWLSVVVYSIMDKYAEKRIPSRIRAKEEKESQPKENPFYTVWAGLKGVVDYDVRFWLISFLCLTYYGGVMPFISISTAFLQEKYTFFKEHKTYSAWLSGNLIILASMILSPILGKILDKVGYKAYFIVAGSLMIIPCHFYLAFSGPESWILGLVCIVCIGFSFSLVPSALWPCIPLIIPEAATGTAFGLMTAIQNMGLAGVNQINGFIIDSQTPDHKPSQKGYEYALFFLTAMDILGLLLGIALIIADRAKDGALMKPSEDAKDEPPYSPLPEEVDSVNYP